MAVADGVEVREQQHGAKPKSRDQQVSLVRKLLEAKGRAAAVEIRNRLEHGSGVTAKGHFFDVEVLKEALHLWELQNGYVRFPPPPPQSWSTDRFEVDVKQPGSARATENEPFSSPSKLKRKAGVKTDLNTKAEAPQPARTPKNTSSASSARSSSSRSARSDLRNFMEASRRRTIHGRSPANADQSEEFSLPRTADGRPYQCDGCTHVDDPVRRTRLRPLASTPRQLDFADLRSPQLETPSSSSSARLYSPGKREQPSSTFAAQKRLSAEKTPDLQKKARTASPFPNAGNEELPQKRNEDDKTAHDPEPRRTFEVSERDASTATVRDLKAWLAEHEIDYSHCVEKAELKALWQRFLELRSCLLAELRVSCQEAGGPCFDDVTSCVRFLLMTDARRSTTPAVVVPPKKELPAERSNPPEVREASIGHRDLEAQDEVFRIIPLRKEAFRSFADWGFAVLGATRDAGSVNRSYRALMRKLHPDKVAQSERVEKTVAIIREAKDICERSLSKVEVPEPPCNLRVDTLDTTIGRRRFQLRWSPPETRQCSPVTRYLVAALDPAYGKPLTITVLEPDYNQELRRFVSIEELNSFILAEEELQKMPSLWKQDWATVQIASANEAGQSNWAKIQVPLRADCKPGRLSVSTVSPMSGSRSSSSWDSGSESSPRANVNVHWDFELELRRRSGPELRRWLSGQLKAPLAAWLKTLRLPTTGTKEELVERVLGVMGFHRA